MKKFLEQLTLELALQARKPDDYLAGLNLALILAYESSGGKRKPDAGTLYRWLVTQVEGTTAEAIATCIADEIGNYKRRSS